MLSILHVLESPLIEALGWALVHFVWQAALLALLLFFLLIPLRRVSARVRYVVQCAVFAAMSACPLVTWCWIATSQTAKPVAMATVSNPVVHEAPSVEVAPILIPPSPFVNDHDVRPALSEPVPLAESSMLKTVSWTASLQHRLTPALPWLVGAWLLGVVVLSLRLLVGWRVVQRLKRLAVSPVAEVWQAKLKDLAARLRISRPVKLVESALIEVPTVIGWLRPVILLPVSLLTRLTPQQLEAILAHELAHIRRHDYLVNLIQTAIETLLFYHPLVWWISSLIRAEREHCCDDIALNLCNNAVTYVTALAAMEELRASPTLTVAATGGSLLSRIRRIAVGSDNVSHRSTRWGASLIALMVIGSLGLTTYFAFHANDDPKPITEQTATKPPNDTTKDRKLSGIQRESSSLEPIQGEVIDAVTGKPIKGATVRFRIFQKLPFDPHGKDKPLAELVFRNVGQYTFELPETVNGQTNLFVERFAEHPDYQSLGSIGQGFYFLPKAASSHARDSIRQVRMVPGKVVTGLVLDLGGQPAKGIAVTSGRYRDGWQNGCEHKTITDAKGRYRLVVPGNGERGRLYVIPDHAAAVSRAITEEFGEQQVFQLRPGTQLFGRVTDANGKGVADVAMRADGSDRVPWRYAMTDADGRYSFPPIQYGTYVVDLYDEARFRELPKNGVRLPDVFLPRVVELPKTAPTKQQVDFLPTESVHMTARYTSSDNQPMSDRSLTISGVANKVHWWGWLRETANQPGLYELRVPRGFAGRFNENADNGGFLRITREAAEGKSVPEQYITNFDKDGISFHVVRMKPSSVTLRPTVDGKPIKPTSPRNYPEFANANDAQKIGARMASSQSRLTEEDGIWFDAHPDIDLVLKLKVDGYKPWQKTVRIPEGENQIVEVPLQEVDREASLKDQTKAPSVGRNVTIPSDQSLADVVRQFNGFVGECYAENKELEQGLDQPVLTEDEVITVLKQDEWKPEDSPLNEKEIAAFKAVAESPRLPKGSSLQVLTEGRRDTFSYQKLWQVKLMLPAIGHDGFVGLTIRDTQILTETIDPQQVAWGKPDAQGLSLGIYLSPKKEKYALGERVKLRLFVRNEGKQGVDNLTFYNISWPKPKDFTVTDQTGAVVDVRSVHDEQWGEQWVAGATAGQLAPGDAHGFQVPFELAIGGNAPSKLVGRVIDARPGQKLSLRVREHNGNDHNRKEGEPEPESGSIELSVAEEPMRNE